jgi:hypothetical protein
MVEAVLTFFGRRLQAGAQKKTPIQIILFFSFKVTIQEAMVDGEGRTTKYAKGAKRQAKLLFKDESYRQSTILKQRANSRAMG